MVVIGTTTDSGTLHGADAAGKSRPLKITISTPPQRFPQCHRASSQLKGGVQRRERKKRGRAIGGIARERERERERVRKKIMHSSPNSGQPPPAAGGSSGRDLPCEFRQWGPDGAGGVREA